MLWHYPLTLLPRARRESCLVLSVTAIACIEFISTGFEYAAFFGAAAWPDTLRYLRGDTLVRESRSRA